MSKLAKFAEKNGVKYFMVSYTDLFGAQRAKLVPAQAIADMETDGAGFADLHCLTRIDAVAAAPHLMTLAELEHVIAAKVPLRAAQNARLHIFRPADGAEEHYAIEIGRPDRDAPVLARLHSACFTGDLLGSLKCDCGPQLRAALAALAEELSAPELDITLDAQNERRIP